MSKKIKTDNKELISNNENERYITNRNYWINKAKIGFKPFNPANRKNYSYKSIFEFAPYAIKIDEEINLIALSTSEYYSSISSVLRTNPDFALKHIEKHPFAYINLSDDVKLNPKVYSYAFENSPHSFQYAPSQLKYNKEIILEFVKKNPMILQYVDKKMKDDLEISAAALNKDPKCLQYLNKSTARILLKDKTFTKKIIDENFVNFYGVYQIEELLGYINIKLRNDIDFMLPYIQRYQFVYKNLGKKILDNEEIMKTLINYNNCAANASVRLKSNEDFMLSAIMHNSQSFYHIDGTLYNVEFFSKAVKVNSSVYKILSDFYNSEKKIVLTLLEKESTLELLNNKTYSDLIKPIIEDEGQELIDSLDNEGKRKLIINFYLKESLKINLTNKTETTKKLKI